LPVDYLRPSLTEQIVQKREGNPLSQSNFHVFSSYSAGFPWRSQAESMLEQFAPLLSKPLHRDQLAALAQQCFRTDLYREAASRAQIDYPDRDYKTEGVHRKPWMLNERIELGSDLMLGDSAPSQTS